jgi:hypothetical protein
MLRPDHIGTSGPGWSGGCGAHHPRLSGRRAAAAAGLGIALLLVLLAGSLASPERADAEVPVIVPPVIVPVKGIGSVGHAVLHPVSTVVEGFIKLLQAIFGGIEARLITAVIKALLTIPNFDTGNVATLEKTCVAISAGMLSAVLTLSIVRYYIAGLGNQGSGGFEALQALSRLAAAVGLIILWPGIFNTVVQVPKLFNAALLDSGGVQHNVALLFDGALIVGIRAFAISTGVGLIFVIIIGLIAAATFIALIWMKVLLSVLLMFLYVSTPFTMALWPIPEVSWLFTAAMRTLLVALMVPCVWAILFALSAAINTDVLTWVPTHSILDTIIVRPLAGITLMILCVTIPRFLVRTAMIGPHGERGGGRLWRTVTIGMLGARVATGAARSVAGAAAEGYPGAQRMIDALPSPVRPPSGRGQGTMAGRMVFGRSGFTPDGKGNSGGGDKPPGGTPKDWGAGGPGGGGGAGPSNPGGPQSPAGQAGGGGAAVTDGSATRRARVDAAGEGMALASQNGPSTPGEVASALAALPEKAQRRIADIRASEPMKLRDAIAHQVGSDAWSGAQRDALWTIGSAQGKEVDEGIATAIGRLNEQPSSAASSLASSPTGDVAQGGSSPAASGGAAAPESSAGVTVQPPGEPRSTAKPASPSVAELPVSAQSQPPESQGSESPPMRVVEQPYLSSPPPADTHVPEPFLD